MHRCIADIRAIAPAAEIIVADGGSRDSTIQIAEKEGAIVCNSEPGRGIQCNAGVGLASGEILLFLHADTELPRDAFEQLDSIFEDDHVQIGTFQLTFDVKHWLLNLYSKPSQLDFAFTRFGDQCIVIRNSFFKSLGGFPDWRLFEDLALVQAARKRTKIYRFPEAVTTSARRFLQNGIIKQQLYNGLYTLQYLMGVKPEQLARSYERRSKKVIELSLGILVRFPSSGKVKTRLAMSLGEQLATDFYRLCAENTFQEIVRLRQKVRRYVFYSSKEEMQKVKRWIGSKFYFIPQVEGTIGEVLECAFSTMFSHGAQKAIVLASDVPDLCSTVIDDAIDALDACDVVIGPSRDGGYYLIGMKRMHYKLFTDIAWSTQKVTEQTMSIIQSSGLTVSSLIPLIDIDTEEDLRHWSKRATGHKSHPVGDFVRNIGL